MVTLQWARSCCHPAPELGSWRSPCRPSPLPPSCRHSCIAIAPPPSPRSPTSARAPKRQPRSSALHESPGRLQNLHQKRLEESRETHAENAVTTRRSGVGVPAEEPPSMCCIFSTVFYTLTNPVTWRWKAQAFGCPRPVRGTFFLFASRQPFLAPTPQSPSRGTVILGLLQNTSDLPAEI